MESKILNRNMKPAVVDNSPSTREWGAYRDGLSDVGRWAPCYTLHNNVQHLFDENVR